MVYKRTRFSSGGSMDHQFKDQILLTGSCKSMEESGQINGRMFNNHGAIYIDVFK